MHETVAHGADARVDGRNGGVTLASTVRRELSLARVRGTAARTPATAVWGRKQPSTSKIRSMNTLWGADEHVERRS